MRYRTVVPLMALASLMPVAPAGAQSPHRGTIITTNKGGSSASLVDLATARVIVELPTGGGPHEVAASSDGRVAVVSDYGAQGAGGNTLTVIDIPGKRVARTVDLGGFTRPHGIAFLPGDTLLAVTSETTGNVVLVRVADGAVVRAIPTGQNTSHMLAVTGDARTIWTGNIRSNTVSELDVTRGTTVRMLPVPSQPEAITVTRAGDEVWVGSNAEGIVSVVRASDGTVETAARGIGWPYRILITPDQRHALIPDYRGGALRILDRATRVERGRISLSGGPQGITVTPDSRTAFVALSQEDRIAIIDIEAMSITGYLPAGSQPDGVAWSRLEIR